MIFYILFLIISRSSDEDYEKNKDHECEEDGLSFIKKIKPQRGEFF